ncbi:MAG: nuclear transport factor 2 family protein [Aurantimonas endophytica]|uniref:nuclear transport factor 2 family protein n=1 Tax=Aurantimonas endophytica TaxID=1522175 RepID=UPI003001F318
MPTPQDIAADYLAVWNTPDDEERRRRLEQWTPDAEYRDPLMRGRGRDGIAAMIAGARAQFPGHEFRPRGTPDGHGAFARFSWTLAPTGGPAVAGGTDIVRLDGRGRIAEIVGFLDGGGT